MHYFKVSEHPHHDGEHCKYRVIEKGRFAASFQPDVYNYLHICQNMADLSEELLDVLANQIELHISHADRKYINDQLP